MWEEKKRERKKKRKREKKKKRKGQTLIMAVERSSPWRNGQSLYIGWMKESHSRRERRLLTRDKKHGRQLSAKRMAEENILVIPWPTVILSNFGPSGWHWLLCYGILYKVDKIFKQKKQPVLGYALVGRLLCARSVRIAGFVIASWDGEDLCLPFFLSLSLSLSLSPSLSWGGEWTSWEGGTTADTTAEK